MTEIIETGVLWSAYPLKQEDIEKIENRFSELLGKKVRLMSRLSLRLSAALSLP